MLKLKLLASLALALALPASAMAATSIDQQNITLAKGDNRTGTYYAGGQTVTVDGDVSGDVVCGAQTVVINGSVGGDVLCGAQTLTINGPVTGSVRAVGQVVTVNGTVGRNITVGAQNFVLGSEAKVGGEVAIGAQTVVLNAPVAGNAYVGAESFKLNSTIGGNLTAYTQTFEMGSSAAVAGNFDYTSDATFQIDKSKVEGQVVRHTPDQPMRQENTPANRLETLLYWVAAALAGALLAVWLTPRLVRGVTDQMAKRWPASFGWGALALIAMPVALVLLAFTFIGLPAVFVLGMLWVIAIMVSGLFAGVAIGRLAWQREDSTPRGLALAALAGVPLVIIAGWLPWLGVLVGLAVTCWALGGMILALAQARKA